MKRIFLNLSLLTCGLLIAATASELGLRLLARETPETATSEQGFMRHEQRTGWYPRENTRQERVDPDGRPFTLRINASGQRGDDIAPRRPGERRILFLGDSFTMADQLAEEEIFVTLAGDLLAARTPHPIRAINGGVDGYGTYQQLAYYRYFGRPLAPDLVVLCLFLGNDFRDNAVATHQGRLVNPVLLPRPERFRSERPLFLRDAEGRSIRDPLSAEPVLHPGHPALTWLARRSFLIRLLHGRTLRLIGRLTGDLSLIDLNSRYFFYQIGFYQQRDDEPFRIARALTLESLEQLRLTALEEGAELLVVLIPSQNQVDRNRWLQDLDALSIDEKDLDPLDMRYPNHLIGDYCFSHRIPCLDLTDPFAAVDSVSALYLTAHGDRHLSAAGHHLAAAEIATFLQQRSAFLKKTALSAYRRGVEQARQGDWEQAESDFSTALAQDENWAPPHRALGEFHLMREEWSQAEVFFRQALSLEPESRLAWEGQGQALAARSDVAGSIEAFERALQLHPGWWPYHRTLVALYELRGDTAQAASHRDRADTILHAPETVRRCWWAEHISAGTAAVDAGRWEAAEREFRSAILFLPNEPVAYYDLGLLYERIGRPDQAQAAYRRALEVAPDFSPSLEKLGESTDR